MKSELYRSTSSIELTGQHEVKCTSRGGTVSEPGTELRILNCSNQAVFWLDSQGMVLQANKLGCRWLLESSQNTA